MLVALSKPCQIALDSHFRNPLDHRVEINIRKREFAIENPPPEAELQIH